MRRHTLRTHFGLYHCGELRRACEALLHHACRGRRRQGHLYRTDRKAYGTYGEGGLLHAGPSRSRRQRRWRNQPNRGFASLSRTVVLEQEAFAGRKNGYLQQPCRCLVRRCHPETCRRSMGGRRIPPDPFPHRSSRTGKPYGTSHLRTLHEEGARRPPTFRQIPCRLQGT